VLDYAHTFGMPAAVFRMSCIYGPHQCGSEDQGWVAHFLIQAIDGKPITLYGDGMQVRDVLFVDDLVDACLLAERHMPHIAGEAFNIGGGPQNTTSLVELIELIETLQGEAPIVEYDAWRAPISATTCPTPAGSAAPRAGARASPCPAGCGSCTTG
jgi:CDP-paratose 2-epimerase